MLTPMMSAYFLRPRVAHPTPQVDSDISQMGALVFGTSQDHFGGNSSFFRGLIRVGRDFADSVSAQGQPVANPGDADSAAGEQV